MSVQVEKLEHNMVKLTVEVPAEELDKAIMKVFNKQKKDFNIPGFRKGKVPYVMIEKMYGPSIFYNDAADDLLQATYEDAVKESGEEIVSTPKVDLVQIEKGKPFIYSAEVAVKPPVTLPDYKGVEVTKVETEVTGEDIEEALDRERENNARQVSVDREIKDGDTAVIDFDGYCDGKQFDGGKAEDYSLVIGSHSFVDNFEDQLIGHKPGEELDVVVTFPENYQEKSLAGKEATFKTKIKEVKEKQLPEADDEFAQDVSEFDTLDEYKDSLKKKIAESKEKNAKAAQQEEALRKVAEKAEMDIPDAMIDTQVRSMINEIEQNLAQQGIPMSMYYQYTGTTEDSLKEQYRDSAIDTIRQTLVLDAIADAEKIEVSDDEIDDELKKMAESYGMDPKTLLEVARDEDKKNIRNDKKHQKALDLLLESAVVVDAPEEKSKDEKEEKKAPAKKKATKKKAEAKAEEAPAEEAKADDAEAKAEEAPSEEEK